MDPSSFVNKGTRNSDDGTKAEWTLYKTLKKHQNEQGPMFVFHGQKYEGNEIDFIQVDMTGVTVYECKGSTNPKSASVWKYKKACSQLRKSIDKLGLDCDIPVKSVVAFPLCKRTPVNHDGDTSILFKDDCEDSLSFNKLLIGSHPAEKLMLDRYIKVVQRFLDGYHTGGILQLSSHVRS